MPTPGIDDRITSILGHIAEMKKLPHPDKHDLLAIESYLKEVRAIRRPGDAIDRRELMIAMENWNESLERLQEVLRT